MDLDVEKGLIYLYEELADDFKDKTFFRINELKFDSLFHNIIRKLFTIDKIDLASILVKSDLKVKHIGTAHFNDSDDEYWINKSKAGKRSRQDTNAYAIDIIVPQEFYPLVSEEDKLLLNDIFVEMIKSLDKEELELFDDEYFEVRILTKLIKPEDNWREELERELNLKKIVNNQGNINDSKKVITYNYLKYRSPAEVEITKELSKWDILYFPLPVSVIKGKKREPDFLIQHPDTKKFGILEINGDTYHTPTNSQQDHERAEIFFSKGILVKFVSAQKCLEKPKEVIKQFLYDLKNF